MNEMFRGIEFIRAYIDYMLILTKGDWSDHINKLELVMKKLTANRLNYNIKKSFLGQTKMEYLSFWVTRTGIQRVNKQLEAIVNMTPPKTQKQVCSSIGLVNYYMDMWDKRSQLLQPLIALT